MVGKPWFLGEEVRDKYTPLRGVTHEGSHPLGEGGEHGPSGIIPQRNASLQGSRQKHRDRGKYPGAHSESSNHQGVHRHQSTQINTNRKPIFPTHTDTHRLLGPQREHADYQVYKYISCSINNEREQGHPGRYTHKGNP